MIKKDLENNILVLGTSQDMDLFQDELEIKNINFLSERLEFSSYWKSKNKI